jgi:hypothetical protein
MWHSSKGELFKPKIALQNLHDGPTRYAEVFGHDVYAYERTSVEKDVSIMKYRSLVHLIENDRRMKDRPGESG